MIQYRCSTGRRYRYPTAYLGLLNWFVDNVEDESHPSVQVASGALFLDQMLAAVERFHGKAPRIDRTQDEESQYIDVLRYINAAGGIRDLRIK